MKQYISLFFSFSLFISYAQISVIDLVNDAGSKTITGFLQSQRLDNDERRRFIAPSAIKKMKLSNKFSVNRREGVVYYQIVEKKEDTYTVYYAGKNLAFWTQNFYKVVEENGELYIYPNEEFSLGQVYLDPWTPTYRAKAFDDAKYRKKVYDYGGSMPPPRHYPELLRSELYEEYGTQLAKTENIEEKIEAFGEIFIELMKMEGFEIIKEISGVATPNKSIGKITINQKEKKEYIYLLMTDWQKPISAHSYFGLAGLSEPHKMTDFLLPYESNHPLKPDEIAIFREYLKADVDKNFTLEIFNTNESGYGKFFLFEK